MGSAREVALLGGGSGALPSLLGEVVDAFPKRAFEYGAGGGPEPQMWLWKWACATVKMVAFPAEKPAWRSHY
jgi:hypothetical protein